MTDKMLKIDDNTYRIDDLPQSIKILIDYYNSWNTELQALHKDTAKTESAIREVLKEMKGELAKLVATGELKPVVFNEEKTNG